MADITASALLHVTIQFFQVSQSVMSTLLSSSTWAWSTYAYAYNTCARFPFQVPRIKAIFHTVLNAVFLLLLTLMLCGFPFWGPIPWLMGGWLRPWMWQSGIWLNGEDAAEVTPIEMVIWFWTLCRLYSEVKQIFRQGAKEHARSVCHAGLEPQASRQGPTHSLLLTRVGLPLDRTIGSTTSTTSPTPASSST